MAKRHANPRLVKIHHTYTVAEVATLVRHHRNTIRHWIDDEGLPVIDGKRPILIHGTDLREFLQARRLKDKRPCHPGEMYCLRCRAPKRPDGDMVEYRSETPTLGNLGGICPTCGCWMNRRVNPAKLKQVLGTLDVALPEAPSSIDESTVPSLNCDFRQEAAGDDKAQCR